MSEIILLEHIAGKIYYIREQKVMLDSDLAELYGVETFNLNKSVNRNSERFPYDFMFRLNDTEFKNLIFQNGMSSSYGGRRHKPYVFTEQGVAMLSGILRSKRAIQVNITIMRAFVKMRQYLSTNKKIIEKLKNHDENFVVVFKLLKHLSEKPSTKSNKNYGFK